MDWPSVGLFLLAAKVIGDSLVTALAWATGAFSLAFALASLAAAARLFRPWRVRTRALKDGELPAVTVLKPLKGEDSGLYENLASFCGLDYPRDRLQILFTLATPDDPALSVITRLRRDFPNLDLEIIVSKNRIGFNPKINNLSNAGPFIKHGLLLLSDSDIRVQQDFLRRTVAAFSDPGVGLVTAFYQSTTPKGLWGRLEALSVNAQFLPQAVLAAALGMRFAMGAAILVRKAAFDGTGGFQNLADHIADDFILGESVQAAGWRLEFADSPVDSVPDVQTGPEHLRHQARWARTIRICRPGGYFGMALLHGFSLLTVKMILFGPDLKTAALALGVLAAKALAKAGTSRLLGGRQSHAGILLLPVSEWIAFCAWLSGLRSDEVLWRGEVYTVLPKGRLVPRRPPLAAPAPATAER